MEQVSRLVHEHSHGPVIPGATRTKTLRGCPPSALVGHTMCGERLIRVREVRASTARFASTPARDSPFSCHPTMGTYGCSPRKEKRMSTGAIIAIIIAAIVLVALVMVVTKRQQMRRLEQRRGERDQLRDKARIHGARAERERATADEQAAAARREAAEADERAVRARQERAAAEEHEARAREVD